MVLKKTLFAISIFGVSAILLSHIYYTGRSEMDIQQTLQKYVDGGTGVGAAIGYIDHGNISYYVYGKKTVESNELISTESVFEIGSITKVFTTLALMEMVKRKKVALDDPIEKFLPGVIVPQKNGHKITLWHLATHTSGLPRLPTNLNLANLDNPYADYSIAKLNEFLNGYTLEKIPGEHAEYSNLGMGLLGHILSVIEHQSYDDLIKTYITLPLGMHNTAEHCTPAMQALLVPGHSQMKKVSNWDSDCLAGAGGLRSTVQDMTRFLAAQMGVLKTTLHESILASQVEQCAIVHKQCFGWMKSEKDNSVVIWHNGGTGGYRSFIGFDLGSQKGIVILSNSTDSFPDELGLFILNPHLFPPKQEQDERSKDLSEVGYLEKFVGIYETEPTQYQGMDLPARVFEVVLLKDKLYYSDYQLVSEAINEFKFKGLPDSYRMRFIIGVDNVITEVQFVQPEGVFKSHPKR